MNNGFTTIAIAHGCEWCSTCLHAADDDFPGMGDAVIRLFHAACNELDRRDIAWYPRTSEVRAYAECDPNDRTTCYGRDGGEPHINLERLRLACQQAVSDCIVNEDDLDDINMESLGDLDQFIMADEE